MPWKPQPRLPRNARILNPFRQPLSRPVLFPSEPQLFRLRRRFIGNRERVVKIAEDIPRFRRVQFFFRKRLNSSLPSPFNAEYPAEERRRFSVLRGEAVTGIGSRNPDINRREVTTESSHKGPAINSMR